MTFAKKLKELREKAGLTQIALAKESGRSLGAIRDYEQGNREPSLKAAVRLADALGVDCTAFTDGKSDSARKPHSRPRKGRNK